jgi:hypothetical protein
VRVISIVLSGVDVRCPSSGSGYIMQPSSGKHNQSRENNWPMC